MRARELIPTLGLLSLALFVTLYVVSCGLISTDPNPPRAEYATVPLGEGGYLLAAAGECPAIDLAEVESWARRARRDMLAVYPDAGPKLSLNGWRLYGKTAPTFNGAIVQGYTDRERKTMFFQCGIERVVRHEAFHVWCPRLDLPEWCDCRFYDHRGGFNLDCSPRLRLRTR